MDLVTSIVANGLLAAAVILGLLWALAHQGIWRGTHHDRRSAVRVRTRERIHDRRRLQRSERMTAASD